MTLAERDAAVAEFNMKDGELRILMASDRRTAKSVNLQADCQNMIFCDVLEGGNTLNQCIGRIYRMGQTLSQKA